ncbi:hypothetical protein M9Y10_040368 [Tritrichomonas musculus]|uniref:Uncharacterized protein n=1 Tax=Tritrichomonas musculus TaxID=1915356 RepID=A0ABR2GRF7_9EUKA
MHLHILNFRRFLFHPTCGFLERIEFEKNSQLRTIEEEVFFRSSLESIAIPSHIKQICRNAFVKCYDLGRVEFEPNSELQKIDERAFSGSSIKSISLPAHITKIHDNRMHFCKFDKEAFLNKWLYIW